MVVANAPKLANIASMPPEDLHPAAQQSRRISDAGWLRLIFLPVFLLGAGFFFVVTLRPLCQMIDSRHWLETPCVVESSQVITHQGDDSTSYSLEVVYHYDRDDRLHTSRRYDFVAGSWSGYHAKQAVVARYPPGRETVCFVNPKFPDQAVLHRGWQPEMGMGGLGLLFAFAGGLVLAFAGKITQPHALTEPRAGAFSKASGRSAPRLEISPHYKCCGYLAGALLWNGFIGFVAYFLFFVEEPEKVATGPKLIIGLMLLVGVFLLIEAFTRLFALIKPRTPPTEEAPAGLQRRRR